MSRKSSNSRDHHHRRPSRRASAPGRDQGYPPQPFLNERQQAREDAVDLPQGDRDPNYYADNEDPLTDTSEQMPMSIAYSGDTVPDYAQAQAFSYPTATDHEQQHWEQWRHRQQWQQWQQQSVAYDTASFPRGPRTNPNTHVPNAWNPDAYIDADYKFEVSDPALQDPSLSSRMSPTSMTAHSASRSPKDLFACIGTWDAPATHNHQYPAAPADLRNVRENPRLNLGELPGRSLRSDSTEALRPSSPFRDIGPSKPPNYDRNHYGEGRSHRRK
ncbi:hypothetical protein CMUS01_10880 [Colletotrichum musicola]|uniref:Uncharacterized protein n=1 Tax=Colletotrichum musicola TaxID=2175873 RepID=A0A8H6N7E4_9PEZI|nr:hypothetical protein CMUS01_10880 [Colletotrichum musicola]